MEQCIWKYQGRYYKVYIEDYRFKRKIDRWNDFKLSCRYFNVNGNGGNGWDYIFPKGKCNQIAQLLGLSLKDNTADSKPRIPCTF